MNDLGGVMAFCASCGFQRTEQSGPCPNCGAPIADARQTQPTAEPDFSQLPPPNSIRAAAAPTPENQAQTEAFLQAARLEAVRAAAESKLFAEVASQRKREEKLEAKRARVQKRKASQKEARDRILANKRLYFPTILFGVLTFAYGVASVVLFATSGPEGKVSEYVEAIKTGDFDALKDPTLFPGSVGSVPIEIKHAFNPLSVKDVTFINVKRDGFTAVATISSGQTYNADEYVINLTAVNDWSMGIPVPVWKIESTAPTLVVKVSTELPKNLPITLESGTTTAGNLDEVQARGSFSVLPGTYRTEVKGWGFYANNISTYELFSTGEDSSIQRQITIEPGFGVMPASLFSKASARAKQTAKSCAASKCKSLPRYEDTDFSLWSRWSGTEYTSSSFTYQFKNVQCSLSKVEALSASKATANYTCSTTAKAHLYIRDDSWYSFYYYWNLYDETTEYFTVQVVLAGDGQSKPFRVTGAKTY